MDRRSTGLLRAIGLMSGTSLDGVDAALITTDGKRVTELGPAVTLPYPPKFRQQLRGLMGREPEADWAPVIEALTDRHAQAVHSVLQAADLPSGAIDVVGFHGQTIWHRPHQRRTCQIGDGSLLAQRLSMPVVANFRSADVAAGGHGAPLAPLYHAARAADLEKPLAVLNIGGVANVTWLGLSLDDNKPTAANTPILAFDTGPGNALLNDWCLAHAGLPWDEGGKLAAAGTVHIDKVMPWLRHDYFLRQPPKSLDRDDFAFVLESLNGLSVEDGAATLTAFTARAVIFALPFLPQAPWRWLVCGGGRHNPTMMAMLAAGLGAPVEPAEAAGWRSDALEAEAFAFLAVRTLKGLPLTLPQTTGVARPLAGGIVYRP